MKQIFLIITGTIGAGKGAIVAYLIAKYGFEHFSLRKFLEEELDRRGMEKSRKNMKDLGNEYREKHGGDFIPKIALEFAKTTGRNVVFESVRCPIEVDFLYPQENVVPLAIDAPRELRYPRIKERGTETDNISFEQFVHEEEEEMHNTDLNKQNLRYCIDKTPASNVIWNDGSIEELQEKVDAILLPILEKQTA